MDPPNDDDVASASALAVTAIAMEDENDDDDDDDKDAELLNAGSSLVALVFANDNIAEKDAPALWCGSGE